MEIPTRTDPSQNQIGTGLISHGRMPIELLSSNVWGVDDWQGQPAHHKGVQGEPDISDRLKLVRRLGEALRLQHKARRSAMLSYTLPIPEFGVTETQELGTLGLKFTGTYRNAQSESLKREVYSLLSEAGKENWDGEGALALDMETVEVAMKLVDRFPPYTAKPEVAATPHGEVDFDWVIDKETMLTVSVSPSKEIAFAGLFQETKLNGSEPWTGNLPHFVDCCLDRLHEHLYDD